MKIVLVDTSAFFAALNADDPQHGDALARFHLAETESWALLTHSYVVQETWALVQSRLGWDALDQWDRILLPRCDVVWVDEGLHALGAARCRQARECRLSLTDCVSLELMHRENIREAFAYDGHLPSAVQ